MKRLLKLGAKSVPIVAIGDQFVHGVDLSKVAEFLKLTVEEVDELSSEEIVEKLKTILLAAQRYFNQIPNDLLKMTAVPNRDRPVNQLGFHIFNISEIFLDTCNGKELKFDYFYNPIPEDMTSSKHIVEYSKQIYDEVCEWWNNLDENFLETTVLTYYGSPTVHKALERETWHTAQHVRQVMKFLERHGIEPDGPLTEEDLRGLPMPDSV